MDPADFSPTRYTDDHHCVLMFSGGRDSTLSALRLHKLGFNLTLITVKSDHLFGLSAVHKRLKEMSQILPSNTPWLTVQQPSELRTDTSFYEMTCLPCHHAYVVIAAALTIHLKTPHLAFGYTGYQNTWPEQTPLATSRLRDVLRRHKIELHLPVYHCQTRQEVFDELCAFGVSTDSLEQKCIRQVNNVELSEDRLIAQINLWEQAIEESMTYLQLIEINSDNALAIGDI